MLSFIKKIFSDPTADWPRSVTDSVLGELRLSDDAEWWEGRVTIGSKTVGFKIGGEGKPRMRGAQAVAKDCKGFARIMWETWAPQDWFS